MAYLQKKALLKNKVDLRGMKNYLLKYVFIVKYDSPRQDNVWFLDVAKRLGIKDIGVFENAELIFDMDHCEQVLTTLFTFKDIVDSIKDESFVLDWGCKYGILYKDDTCYSIKTDIEKEMESIGNEVYKIIEEHILNDTYDEIEDIAEEIIGDFEDYVDKSENKWH